MKSFLQATDRLFDEHQQDGGVVLEYDTDVHFGKPV
jgi:hypothetical protein